MRRGNFVVNSATVLILCNPSEIPSHHELFLSFRNSDLSKSSTNRHWRFSFNSNGYRPVYSCTVHGFVNIQKGHCLQIKRKIGLHTSMHEQNCATNTFSLNTAKDFVDFVIPRPYCKQISKKHFRHSHIQNFTHILKDT